MTRNELLDKLKTIEQEVKEVREFLSRDSDGNSIDKRSTAKSATIDLQAYTLEDLYKELSTRKHYAVRLRHALERRGINTLTEFLSLSPGERLDLENIGYETLIHTKKALDKMGIGW